MVRSARKVRWTRKALNEKFQIFKYWNGRNKSNLYSKELDNILSDRLKKIADNPWIGRATQRENVFTVVVRDILIVYEVLKSEIVVIELWEGHQNPESFNY